MSILGLELWDRYHCVSLVQNDGLQIGAIGASLHPGYSVPLLSVYYFGYLAQAEHEYRAPYANLSIGGSYHRRVGMVSVKWGVAAILYKAHYIATSSFANWDEYPEGKPLSVYFNAEERHPTRNPPFALDDSYGAFYRGAVPKLIV